MTNALHYHTSKKAWKETQKDERPNRDGSYTELSKHHIGILEDYINAVDTVKNIAEKHGVSSKTVQRIAKNHSVSRTIQESFILSQRFWEYRSLPPEEKKRRKQLSAKLRYQLIAQHPYCRLCGATASLDRQLQIDHIDKNPANNTLSNLQVLCDLCNIGKGGKQ